MLYSNNANNVNYISVIYERKNSLPAGISFSSQVKYTNKHLEIFELLPDLGMV